MKHQIKKKFNDPIIFFPTQFKMTKALLRLNQLTIKMRFTVEVTNFVRQKEVVLILDTQLTFTCSKLTMETLQQRYEICSKLTIKSPKRRHWRRSGIFIVNFEHISHLCSTVSIVNFEHVIAGWDRNNIFFDRTNNGRKFSKNSYISSCSQIFARKTNPLGQNGEISKCNICG